jgi:ComF family protein
MGLSNVIVPPVCLACRVALADHHALCPTCWRDVAFIRAPLCERIGIPLPFDTGGPSVSAAALAEPPDFDRARAAAHFAGTARKLVHDFKYQDRQEVRVLLGNWLTAAGHELLGDAHLIVPVPMSRRRLFWRTFNQAAHLAHELGARSGVVVDTATLKRRRATRPQVGLTRAQRRDNMEGAFGIVKWRRGRVQGANILLVDDVITTGATVNACARALRRAGAARVDVLVVAMVAGDLAVTP